jgi:hypothetical protein
VGTDIGDVGIVTSDGSFDVIFNICRAADDPVNRFGVPEGFEQVNLGPGDVAPRAQYHRSGSDVSNTRISKRRLDVDAGVESNVQVSLPASENWSSRFHLLNRFLPLGAGAIVEISTSSKEAAVLLLPDGASRADLRRLKNFRDYAIKHAQRWYAFVNGDLERMVENGDLYLVTGTDKSTSWSVAAVENHSEDCRISLKLKAAQLDLQGHLAFGNGKRRTRLRTLVPEDFQMTNGPRIRLCFCVASKLLYVPPPLKKSAKAISIVHSKPSDILSKAGGFPFLQSRSTSTSGLFRSSTTSGSGGASDDEESVEDSAEYFPAGPQVRRQPQCCPIP